jgi:hypothetical protein
MTKILAFAGRKQSGKNTAANFVFGSHLVQLGLIRYGFKLTPNGELYIHDLWGEKEFDGVLDVCRRDNDTALDFLEKHVNPYIKQYSFADLLKEMCIVILGLHPDQCYGSDAHKNTNTDYKWGDMLGLVDKELQTDKDMTAREVLQYVGTNIFRRMYNNVWVDATIRRIEQENTELAVITDCRFPNEVEGVQKAGGKVVKLTRNPSPEDSHASETALDKDQYDWSKFDAVIDNAEMTISEQNEALYNVLIEWDYIPSMEK